MRTAHTLRNPFLRPMTSTAEMSFASENQIARFIYQKLAVLFEQTLFIEHQPCTVVKK